MDGLYARNVVVANRNRAMIFSDYVSEGDSIDEETEYWEDCVERTEGDSESGKDVTSDDCCCTGVDPTDSCCTGVDPTDSCCAGVDPTDSCCTGVDPTDSRFFGKDKTKWGKVKSSTHIRRRWQNILTNLPVVNGQARKARDSRRNMELPHYR